MFWKNESAYKRKNLRELNKSIKIKKAGPQIISLEIKEELTN